MALAFSEPVASRCCSTSDKYSIVVSEVQNGACTVLWGFPPVRWPPGGPEPGRQGGAKDANAYVELVAESAYDQLVLPSEAPGAQAGAAGLS